MYFKKFSSGALKTAQSLSIECYNIIKLPSLFSSERVITGFYFIRFKILNYLADMAYRYF